MKNVGNKTVGQFVSEVTTRLKSYTKKDLTPIVWLSMINDKVNELHGLLSIKDRDVYKDRVVLTDPQNVQQGGVVDFNSGCTYTDSTRTVYIPAANFAGGAFSGGITSALLIPVGSIVMLQLAVGGANIFISEVESTPNATSVKLKTAFGSNLTEDYFRFIVMIPASLDIFNIGNYSFYPKIDMIHSIFSSGLNDECKEADTMSDFRGMVKRHLQYTQRDCILWTRDAELIYFASGPDVVSRGTLTMYYYRKPELVTENDSIIDFPPENMSLLVDMCMLAGLQTIQVPIPAELKSSENKIEKLRTSKALELAEKRANKSDQ